MTAAATQEAIHYPSSDGKPMAETGIHVRAMHLLHQALEDFFRPREDVFIASDMFWYWKEGYPEPCTAPDVMVVPGVGNHDRRSFKSWEEGGAVPAVVFEMISEGTWKEDVGTKFDLYEELGVREYFMFDPEVRHQYPALVGYRLNRSAYRRILLSDDSLVSELGFTLRAEGTMIRLANATTGELVLTRSEWAEQAEARAAEAVARADEALARADEERALATQSSARAAGLQAEVERLRELLKKYGHANGNGP